MNTILTRRLTAATMASAAVLAMAGFTALGSIFDYPKILRSPVADILAVYRQHDTAISAWFAVLVLSATLLAPAGVGLGRLGGGRIGPWIAGTGIAAALVQVVGLSRWVLVVPGISDDALLPGHTQNAYHRFQVLHTWLGTIIGDHRIRPDRRIHRSRRPYRHPSQRSALARLPRLCICRTHRHRRRHSARAGRRAPHKLRRIRDLVCLAGRYGDHAVAQQAPHPRQHLGQPKPRSARARQPTRSAVSSRVNGLVRRCNTRSRPVPGISAPITFGPPPWLAARRPEYGHIHRSECSWR
jgi:hypothetical protein